MNRGLDKAQGTYVGILEPDDYPEKDMFERLFNAARRGSCDLVKCNFFEHCEGVDTPVENLRGLPRFRSFDPARYPYSICRMPSIWASLYRSEMLKREGIRFRETPGASFQDTSFVLKAWFAARRCALVRKPLLHYRMDNPESSSKTTDKVFVVCDEMADCERFLRERLDRCRGFIPWFYVDKWGKYRWNYNRIDASCHEAFAERMFEEYAAALEACELDLSLFEPPVAKPLKALLDGGARQFAAEYPAGF